MRFWKRREDSPPRESPSGPFPDTDGPDDRDTNALTPLFDDLAGNSMPEALEPKDDPSKQRVFADEIDPAWRDPETGQ